MMRTNLSGAVMGTVAVLLGGVIGSPVFAASSAGQATPSPVAATHSTVLKLVQSPEPRYSTPSVPPIPGTTPIDLPLFPGATVSTQPYPDATIETPGSWYVRTAKAEYLLTEDNGTVEGWYDNHMTQLGFRKVGTARSGNLNSGVTSIGQIYAPVHHPHGHDIEVDLSFLQSTGNKTLLMCWATDVVVPPRPSYTFIPKDVVSMDIQMTANGNSVNHVAKHVDDPATIQRFRLTVNALTDLVSGINHGGPASFGNATVVLHTRRGKTISMTVSDRLGISVNKVGITDYNSSVWKIIEGIMGVHGFPV